MLNAILQQPVALTPALALFLPLLLAAQEPSAAGSLSDVHAAMKQAQQRLAAGDTGQQTQQQQITAIELLAALIEAAQAREHASQSSSSGSGSSQQSQSTSQSSSQSQSPGQPGASAGQGTSQPDQPASAPSVRNFPQSPWSKLRDKERDPVYSAIKERFPTRYQQLLEQYYQSFQNAPPR